MEEDNARVTKTPDTPSVFPTAETPHIVCATNFSAASRAAFCHALRIALAQTCRLTLLHVGSYSRETVPWERFPGVRTTLVDWGLLPPEADRQEVGGRFGVQVAKRTMRDEEPAAGVVDFLAQQPANLLVMATEGRSGLPLLGRASVALRVLRATRLPTLLLPGGTPGFVAAASGQVSLARVLVPVDHAPDARQAIAFTTALCGGLAERPTRANALHVGVPEHAPRYLLSDTEKIRWQWQCVPPGEVVAAIVAQAQAEKADLVVMPTAGPSGLRERLVGSTLDRLLSRLGCPLLAIPTDAELES
jgi:nucleotide-binding universal stress UspA family protein